MHARLLDDIMGSSFTLEDVVPVVPVLRITFENLSFCFNQFTVEDAIGFIEEQSS